MAPEKQEVLAADGTPLGSRFYLPDEEARAAVLIVSAMGVSQAYYASFASWLGLKAMGCAPGFYIVPALGP